MACQKLAVYDYFASVEAKPKSADRRNAIGNRITATSANPSDPSDPSDLSYTSNNLNQYTSVEAKPKSAHRRNANKNITELLDDTGTIRAHYEYSPFGKITAMSGDKAADNPFRFSSEYHDDETALVYYNYRYYSPKLGRWLKRDPIGEEGFLRTANFKRQQVSYEPLYAFVSNNPVASWDERGLYTIDRIIDEMVDKVVEHVGRKVLKSSYESCLKIGGLSQEERCGKQGWITLCQDCTQFKCAISAKSVVALKKCIQEKKAGCLCGELP